MTAASDPHCHAASDPVGTQHVAAITCPLTCQTGVSPRPCVSHTYSMYRCVPEAMYMPYGMYRCVPEAILQHVWPYHGSPVYSMHGPVCRATMAPCMLRPGLEGPLLHSLSLTATATRSCPWRNT